jgi:hypothetical protein
VLARDIYKSDFIGSPLALAALLARDKLETNFSANSWMGDRHYKVKPLLVRKIEVIYDMKSVLHPLIDHGIHYYPIPHRHVLKFLLNAEMYVLLY